MKQILAFLLLNLFVLGCQPKSIPPEQLRHGLVYMFPGIEGGYWSLSEARRAFHDAGIRSAIKTHDWKYPFLPLMNLMDYQANRNAARLAAQWIVQYQKDYPGRSVDLVGFSGGGGLAILVAEELPETISIRNILLIHAAIDPKYDLTCAIRHVSGQLVNFHSDHDWLILGAGTSVFGTIDRQHTASAGMKGFDVDVALPDPSLRSRFRQVKWTPALLKEGHLGGHFTIAFYRWNKDIVAPCLLDPPCYP